MTNNIAQIMTENVNGTTFISMDTETSVKLTGGKKNPLQGRVTKQQRGSVVMVFQNKNANGYENMVKKHLIEEGKDPESFQLGPRKWGERITDTPFIEHKGKHYLEVIFLHAGETIYYVDGVETDSSQIEGLPVRKEGEQGGVSNKVVIRTFSIDSIKRLTVNKQQYTDLVFEL